MAILGYLNMIGVGHHFIMEGGFSVTFTDGHGFQAMIGDLLGSIGDQVEVTMAGCHLGLKLISIAPQAIITIRIGYLCQDVGY
tara:strand:+ start:149172 stop:149420 length:249 start_codon:yes stop_codon:yes gene_type:complete